MDPPSTSTQRRWLGAGLSVLAIGWGLWGWRRERQQAQRAALHAREPKRPG